MNNLFIPKEKGTPEIDFNQEIGTLSITGQSYPEDSSEFYVKVIEWVREFISSTKQKVTFNVNLQYFNTSSSKAILDILEMLDNYFKTGNETEVNWFYTEEDDDIYDHGIEFTEDLSMPCKLILC